MAYGRKWAGAAPVIKSVAHLGSNCTQFINSYGETFGLISNPDNHFLDRSEFALNKILLSVDELEPLFRNFSGWHVVAHSAH
jgi:hypothetical protein